MEYLRWVNQPQGAGPEETPEPLTALQAAVLEVQAGLFLRMNLRDRGGQTVLHLLAEQGDAETIRKLLNQEGFANGDAEDFLCRKTAFHRAASYSHASVCSVLLDKLSAATINAADRAGWSALHTAAYHDSLEVVSVILGHHRFTARRRRTWKNETALDLAREACADTVEEVLRRSQNIVPI